MGAMRFLIAYRYCEPNFCSAVAQLLIIAHVSMHSLWFGNKGYDNPTDVCVWYVNC